MALHWKICWIVIFILFGLTGCNLPTAKISSPVSEPSPTIDPNYLAFLLSQTQTAQASVVINRTPNHDPLAITDTPENFPRCNLFVDMDITLYVLDFTTNDPFLKIYIKMPDGVPGLSKKIAGDQQPWDYQAALSGQKSLSCYLQNFEDRLYCEFPMLQDYRNTTRDFSLYVNHCENPLYQLKQLALNATKPTQQADDTGCGSMPITGCSADYDAWCICKGGTPGCSGQIAYCIYP